MKIAVVGCGGIGGVVCAVLASRGAELVCIEAKEEYAKKITSGGIKLEGKLGRYSEKIRSFGGFSRSLGKFDVIILAVKSNTLRSVFTVAKDYLSDRGFILTLQNGLEIINIIEEHPSIRVAGGAVGYNSVMVEYGNYLVTSEGGITIGSLQHAPVEGMEELKSIFDKGIEITITKSIVGVLWSKLLMVCGVTGLGGISGLLTGELMRHRVARKLFYRIVREGREVASRSGVRLEPFGGIRPERFSDQKPCYPPVLRWILLKIVGRRYRELKSNIHHSLERGEKTEIDWLNGALVSFGEKAGVATPVNREIVRMVKEIEVKKRKMAVDNLYEIWERVC